ncbi:MAG: L-serine ammonia-lyase, iron-sulfur-dependent, subunit alpha [Candidatus Izimaplasma sp.]|nr:L-serine ammonia-lyase, iron-sulfur-dependent, subunit alpha [Candidatus Izimaplasma bacterium]
MLKKKIQRILNGNISKTMGCTDIGVVGYISSLGAYTLRHDKIKKVTLSMSEELYKNSVNVGVPGLRVSGLDKALALGILLKNPKKQLSVFENVTNDEIDKIDALLEEIDVEITHQKYNDTVLFEQLNMETVRGDTVEIIIKDYYDNVVSVKRNDKLLKEYEQAALLDRAKNKYTIDSFQEILDYVRAADFTGLDELFHFADMQYSNARKEIKKTDTSFLIENVSDQQRTCLYDMSNFLRKHIEVPSTKRMQGDIYTVYGVAGSGNLGIGTLVTPMLLADAFNSSPKERQQLIVLSFLTSVYIKQGMNVVTVLCGTGHATGSASAAVTAFMKNLDDQAIKKAVNLYLSSAMGFICDGAKISCTHKVSFAAMNGMIAGKMVSDKSGVCDGYGLNKIDLEATITNLGKLNNDILTQANKGIIELI